MGAAMRAPVRRGARISPRLRGAAGREEKRAAAGAERLLANARRALRLALRHAADRATRGGWSAAAARRRLAGITRHRRRQDGAGVHFR